MALDQSALLELLGELKLTDVTDRIRVATETLYQELIDAEAAAFIGAAPFERSPERVTQRNGTRPRTLTTTAGDLELRLPKLRQGSFFPSLLERRRRVDQALFAVVMEAYVHGVSTRKVDDLVKALGADTGISKSEVSRICANLDEDVAAFRDRPLADTTYPYVFLDATYCKARVGRRVVSQAVVVAIGVAADIIAEQIAAAVCRTLAVRVGVALSLYATRAPVDICIAAARAGQLAGRTKRAADGTGRIAECAAQTATEAATKPAAAAQQLRRNGGRKRHGRRGERQCRNENAVCHCPSPQIFGPEGMGL